MASTTLTDRGSTDTLILFERSGAGMSCTVTIRHTEGQKDVGIKVADALTPGEQTALGVILPKLYAAALTAAGFR